MRSDNIDLENKYRAALSRLIENEQAELSKVRKKQIVFYFIGILMILGSIAESLGPTRSFLATTLIGIIGGYLFCVGIYLRNTLKAWPILKSYLNEEKLLGDSNHT